ncbi:MAG: pitrilysin family protein [Planctomycetota bacterium]|nr:pitrilysin family protein [Planctomycetota bacterium]
MIAVKKILQLSSGGGPSRHPHLTLHIFQTSAFKTTTIKVFIHLPLDENATANALLVRVLGRGSRKYPTMKKMSRFLDSLYGAIFGADISKIGERHIIEFYFEFISRRFLPSNKDNTRYALNFLKEVIFNPLIQKGSFRQDYFSQEQQKLKDLIKGLYDDKIGYAEERCIQTMCQDEPFRHYEYGEADKVEALTADKVLKVYYENVIRAPIDIFICGQSGQERMARMVSDVFRTTLQGIKKEQMPEIPPTIVDKQISKERLVKETDEIDQAKLVMGYRTCTTWQDADIFALMMASGILGGFPHSKLFRYVREKEGLAYYVNSGLDKTKGLMFIQAGINPDRFEKTLHIIKKQVSNICAGEISDEELNNTLAGILNRLKSIEDNGSSFIDYDLELSINNRAGSFKTLKDRFLSVKKEDIARACQKIKLDTIYLLEPVRPR